MWERWNSFSKKDGYNPQSMNSLNHYAYGAVGQWMYERIAGLSALEPGYKKIKIAPVPNIKYVTSASASLQTPYGKASSSWKIEKETFNLKVVIPPNTTAEIHLPKEASKSALSVNDRPLAKLSTLKLIASKDKSIILSVASGTYNITTNINSNE
jgi:alpha-L-rhamnosidase